MRVFNPGRVPVVVDGHAVGAGEWSDVDESAAKPFLDDELLIVEAEKPKTDKPKEPSR